MGNRQSRRNSNLAVNTHKVSGSMGRLSKRWIVWLMLGFTLAHASACHSQDWPRIISKLERGGQQQRRKQLPTAYNNYAIALSNRGEWSEAAKQLEKAVALDRNNDRFKSNLATIYLNHAYELRQQRRGSGYELRHKATRLAKQALRHDRDLAEAHVLIGDIAYENQDLHLAKISWTRAKLLEPALQTIQDRLAKLATESTVEKHFDRASNAYFDLRYQDGIAQSTAFDLRTSLQDARKKIGHDFKYWPRHKLVVLVYSKQAFARVRQGPDWVAGIYDGKIRIPLPDTESAAQMVKPTLYHEYTHAMVHDLTRNHCPVWLNEGIAEYEESKVRSPSLATLRSAARIDRLVPFENLDASFKSSDLRVAGLAYEQSYTVVKYLIDKFGFYRLRRTLEHLAQGTSTDEAFQLEYRMTLAQLERRWQRWLPDLIR